MATSQLVIDALDAQEAEAAALEANPEPGSILFRLNVLEEAAASLIDANRAVLERLHECEGMVFTVANQQAANVTNSVTVVEPSSAAQSYADALQSMEVAVAAVTKRARRKGQ